MPDERHFARDRFLLANLPPSEFEARIPIDPAGEIIVIRVEDEVLIYRTGDTMAKPVDHLNYIAEEGEHVWIAEGFAVRREGRRLHVFASGNKPMGTISARALVLAVKGAEMASGQGFEPRSSPPKGEVLPLNEPEE